MPPLMGEGGGMPLPDLFHCIGSNPLLRTNFFATTDRAGALTNLFQPGSISKVAFVEKFTV